jgi:ATP/maltotriose-dependent transcriptional regulator MalT
MAESPAVAPAGMAVLERDVLLATKLHVPGPRPGFVPRPRLVGALGDGLVLVCAPAGFGKTALLADWLRSGDRPVAWLSLDAGDNDPVRFWRHLVAALDRVRPGTGERVAPLLGPSPSSFEGLVTALINELAASPGDNEIVLVLDDYHLVDAQVRAAPGLVFAGPSCSPGALPVAGSGLRPGPIRASRAGHAGREASAER